MKLARIVNRDLIDPSNLDEIQPLQEIGLVH
jgi:hypothetical protein